MGIKRKHFDDASPTSISSSGFVSTPDAQSPTRFPHGLDGSMDMEMDTEVTPKNNGWDFSRAQRTKSSDWGLRTRKRVRDNRPDERAIQENTVHKLFLAQRQPHTSPVSSSQPDAQAFLTVIKPQKSTLHSFWTITAPPVQTPMFSYHTPSSQTRESGPRCEDCDACLDLKEEGMDVDMDMGGMDESTFACRECSKHW
ncbi:hypothetical protein E8E11_002778 [Didymella keratinophila]|nr:hypothetical protein E8E11_002778 [Didymella keratinophila]